jgi:phospholipid/cholesterol/gamma-HCH transport system ATP-binding protein
MIEVKNITKSFGEKQVLTDISAVFEKGKTNLIIGQSGCGKSVLLKCIVGLEEIDQGQVIFDGRNFSAMNFDERKAVRKEIGMLFQGNALFDSMTVEENIKFPLDVYTTMSEDEKLERVNFCLHRVNLNNINNRYPAEISGGMKKRVALARAIALNPQYLFVDEPNSGLDPQTAIVIDALIKEITEDYQMTTVVVTHDMNSVMEIGENILFIYKGQAWWKGNNKEIVYTDNKELNDFIFASNFMRRYKESFHI